ncbi:hypothetical protein Mtc_1987 [Methanocella conradii HZ254]|uniref:Uncharacterized protein n=1 Tax=Methanocella conradii (strain DSM 24694 / JCM 17849 / CGMCC 1.5162 / HZ254) TaxID=1041930 RepID=H8I680_METCZ|nr:hypothetical protein [Methanocella conradii]AFD00727.1 hypothetical protein Mtc_1987 [Methanocella conradii HZ254]
MDDNKKQNIQNKIVYSGGIDSYNLSWENFYEKKNAIQYWHFKLISDDKKIPVLILGLFPNNKTYFPYIKKNMPIVVLNNLDNLEKGDLEHPILLGKLEKAHVYNIYDIPLFAYISFRTDDKIKYQFEAHLLDNKFVLVKGENPTEYLNIKNEREEKITNIQFDIEAYEDDIIFVFQEVYNLKESEINKLSKKLMDLEMNGKNENIEKEIEKIRKLHRIGKSKFEELKNALIERENLKDILAMMYNGEWHDW